MKIARPHWEELVAHAREVAPEECCGILKLDDGAVAEVRRAENERHSPFGYELDTQALLAAYNLEEDGFGVAVYHSHPRSAPEPSQTDINLAEYPDRIQVIISLAGEPSVRAWRIRDGAVSEEELEVE
jgi:proteasome lid subunit RPN8/RPN11